MKIASVVFIALLSAMFATSSLGFQQSEKTYRPLGNEGTLTGKISFSGEAPRPRQLDMHPDAECVKSHPEPLTEDVIITDGSVANVLVYVKSKDLDAYNFEPPSSPVTLERKGCQLIPHVFGIQTGQTLLVLNNSPTTHNTNVQAVINPAWNRSQAPGGVPLEKIFELPERLVIIKDNQHPWERAYLSVFSHPFFMVTGNDGSYTIAGLPVGEYTLVAWHEKFGEQELEVHVSAGETKNVDFSFK